MGDLLSDIVSWMATLSPVWAYLLIFVIAYGENVVPPIPGDMVVVFGGYLVGLGRLDFWLVVLLSTLGGAVGFMTMFAIGRRVGNAVYDPQRLRWLPKHQIGKVDRWLRRWGYVVVLANRFLSGLRSVISLTVGMSHMDPVKTTVFATISALVWTALIAYGGYAVGDNWPVISVYLRQYGRAILALLAVLAAIQLLRVYLKRRLAAKP
jgi:membrane protein DedA with SNARE-associated domain